MPKTMQSSLTFVHTAMYKHEVAMLYAFLLSGSFSSHILYVEEAPILLSCLDGNMSEITVFYCWHLPRQNTKLIVSVKIFTSDSVSFPLSVNLPIRSPNCKQVASSVS